MFHFCEFSKLIIFSYFHGMLVVIVLLKFYLCLSSFPVIQLRWCHYFLTGAVYVAGIY